MLTNLESNSDNSEGRSSPVEVVSPPETSQARQRLTVATSSASLSSASNPTRGASALSIISNVTSRAATARQTGILWNAQDESSTVSQNSGSFVVEMPLNATYSFRLAQSPLDVESNSTTPISGAEPEMERQARRSVPVMQDRDSSEDDTGITGQVSSVWNQTVNQNPEISWLLTTLEKYIPFVLIVAIKCLFEHATGIFVFVGMMITFYHGNSVVCREVSRQTRRSIWPLVAVLINLTACIVFIYFVFSEEELYLCAIFLSIGKVNSLYDLIWYVGINDFILKFFAVIVKICIVMLPGEILPHRKRGGYFLFIESSNQLHRTLAPIPIWLHYLLESLHTDTIKIPAKVLGVILTAAYMALKGRHILKTTIDWKNATSKLMQSTRYGRCPSMQEVKASGSSCPICHDSLQDPTILHCKHIFCEECVSTWFDRERTCPMCRAQVTDDPAWRDGSTSQFIQLF